MTPDRYEDIAFEMNHELGQAEQREINRRVEHARAHCSVHGVRTPCGPCSADHLAGEHLFGSHHATCARCAEIATDRPEPDAQHLAAADDTLDSPNEGDPR